MRKSTSESKKKTKAAERINKGMKITNFKVGEKVLLKAYPISDAMNKIVSKFCDLYHAPYVIKEKVGKATYIIASPKDHEKERGKFNIHLLKKYYE